MLLRSRGHLPHLLCGDYCTQHTWHGTQSHPTLPRLRSKKTTTGNSRELRDKLLFQDETPWSKGHIYQAETVLLKNLLNNTVNRRHYSRATLLGLREPPPMVTFCFQRTSHGLSRKAEPQGGPGRQKKERRGGDTTDSDPQCHHCRLSSDPKKFLSITVDPSPAWLVNTSHQPPPPPPPAPPRRRKEKKQKKGDKPNIKKSKYHSAN